MGVHQRYDVSPLAPNRARREINLKNVLIEGLFGVLAYDL